VRWRQFLAASVAWPCSLHESVVKVEDGGKQRSQLGQAMMPVPVFFCTLYYTTFHIIYTFLCFEQIRATACSGRLHCTRQNRFRELGTCNYPTHDFLPSMISMLSGFSGSHSTVLLYSPKNLESGTCKSHRSHRGLRIVTWRITHRSVGF